MERELTFRDAPMFARVMMDEGLCRGVIESILGIRIEKVVYQGTEEEGRAEGLAEGEERMKALMGRLLNDGRLDDMRLLAAGDIDADRLFKEYGL